MDPKTTPISEEKFHPLEVEWMEYTYGRYKIMPDGTSKRLNGKRVSLVSPGYKWCQRSPILHLEPQTALNLLNWLTQEKPLLEQLAQLEREEEQLSPADAQSDKKVDVNDEEKKNGLSSSS